MAEKQFGGTIKHWHKVPVPIDKKLLRLKYGKTLGYCIRGYMGVDPTNRGFSFAPIRTSLVVKMNKDQTEIETLNTIYHLEDENKYG